MKWQDFFYNKILENSSTINDSNINITRNDNDCIDAQITGSELYILSIKKDLSEIFCDCPFAIKKQYCKHMAALLNYCQKNNKYYNINFHKTNFNLTIQSCFKEFDENEQIKYLSSKTGCSEKEIELYLDTEYFYLEKIQNIYDEKTIEYIAEKMRKDKKIIEKISEIEFQYLEFTNCVGNGIKECNDNEYNNEYDESFCKKIEKYQNISKNILGSENVDKKISKLNKNNHLLFQDNEEQLLYILMKTKDTTQIKYMSDKLKKNKQFALKAVIIDAFTLQYFDNSIKDNEEIVFEAVKSNRLAFQYASERLRNNKELALLALKHDGQPFSDVGDSLKNDREVVMAAVQNFGVSLGRSVSEELRDDKEIILKAVEKNPWNLAAASERLKDDKEVVLTAIKRNFKSLEDASERLQNDEDIAIHMIKHDNDLNFCYICEKYYYDDELKNENCPNCLGKVYHETIYKEYDYLGKKLAYNEKFITALKSESFKHLTEILNTINKEITDNEFFMKEMVKIDDRLFSFASVDLLNNINFVKFAIDKNIQNIIYAGYNILNDEEFLLNNIKDKVILDKIKALKEYYIKENKKRNTTNNFYIRLATEKLNKFNRIADEFEIGLELYKFLLENQYFELYNISKIDIKKLSTNDDKILNDLKTLQNKIKIKEEERYEQYKTNR